MAVPSPPQAVVALATYLRDRLADVSGTVSATVGATVADLAPLLRGRPDGVEIVTDVRRTAGGPSVLAAARHMGTIVVGAAAPFATTSYARARLIRQLHATGLLTADQVHRVSSALELYQGPVIEGTADTAAESIRRGGSR